MEVTITYEEGHAHVAAIRVLKHRLGRPPTIEEVADILGSQVEITNHRLRALEALGIVEIVESPFEVHLSVRDHLALEKLPAEASEEGLAEAVEEFRRRQKEKADEALRIFGEGEREKEKREKLGRMARELRSYKPKKSRKAPWEKGGS